MNSLSECIEYYYTKENYNCAEAVIRGANDFYGLDIGKEDMKMFGGYGAGIYAGLVCGALIAGAAVLSKMVVVEKAREEQATVRPVINGFVKTFRELLQGTSCAKETSCLKTVLLASQALEISIGKLKQESM